MAAACLCAASIVLLTLGSLYSPIFKLHLRPFLAWQFLPLSIRAHQHRLLHICGFALPALLFFAVFRSTARATAAASLLAPMAVTLEFIQHRIYSSPLEWWDICDDISGVLLALLLVSLHQRRQSP